MPGQETVDILILSGTGRVRRYHLRPAWLRALWLTPICLTLLLLVAALRIKRLSDAVGAATATAASLRTELETVGERLVRLENIEKVLRSKDMTELETLLAAANPDDPGWWKKASSRPNAGDSRLREAAPPDLSKLLGRVDANQAGVDNLKAKIENHALLLNFDLSNISSQSNLTGHGEVALVGNDASLTPLRVDKEALTFQIQRFKQIAVSLALPSKYVAKDVYGFKLTVLDPAGKTIFSQVYPLSAH